MRLRRILARAVYAAAWVTVGVVGVCIVLDRSGWISDSIRGRITRALPGLDVEVGHARVLWFRPGLVLERVTLQADDGFLAFDTVEVRLTPATAWSGVVREVEIIGGRARVTDELIRTLEGVVENRGEADDEESSVGGSSAIPTVTLTDFRVDLVLPGEAALPIGTVDLLLEGRGTAKRLAGRLLPDLAGGTPEAAVHIDGRLDGDRLEFRGSARRLPLDTDLLPTTLVPSSPIVERASALLTLVVEGELDFKGDVRPRVEGRAELAGGEARFSVSNDPLSDVAARVELSWTPERGDGLWSRRAWDGAAEVDARWGEVAVDLRARAGRSADEDTVQGWVSIPELPLAEDERPDLSLGRGADAIVDALGLSGTAGVSLGLRVPPLRGEEASADGVGLLVDVRPRADAGVRYDGFVDRKGRRWGIPLPVKDVGGHVLLAHQWGHARPTRLGLVELSGKLPNGEAYYEGTIWSPAPEAGPDAPAEFQMELWVPRVAIDEDLGRALDGMPVTAEIYEDYGPGGEGEATSRWRFRSDPDSRGLTAWGAVEFRAERMRWKPLPIPVNGATGRLALRWADRSIELADGDFPGATWRPFGLRVEVTGELDSGGEVDTRIQLRNEAPDRGVMTTAQLPPSSTHDHRVRIEGMSLSGPDFEVVAEAFPVARAVAQALGLDGRADVTYRGLSHGPGAPYRFDLELEPTAVRLRPERFPLDVEDLRGRVLFTSVRPFTSDEEADPVPDQSLRGAITAVTEQGYEVVGVPWLEPGEDLGVTVHGAGFEPDDERLLAAFRTALELGEDDVVDPEVATLAGVVDGHFELTVPATEGAAPSVSARVELRRNSLAAGRFRLDDLSGTARFEGSVLTADRIRARLGSGPVELVDFRLAPSDRAGSIDALDPMLAEPGFVGSDRGLVVQSKLRARDFELSEENLGLFLDPEAVGSLVEEAELFGRVDFEDTRIVLAPDRRGGLKVGMHGDLVPHNTNVRVGLPVQMSSSRVRLDALQIEDGRLRARANVTDLFGRVAGRQVERVSFLATVMESRVAIEELDGTLEGGSLTSFQGPGASPALAVDLREPHFFTAAIAIGQNGRVDANGLMRGLFETAISDKGRASGWLRLSGTPADVLGIRGIGAIEVDEAQLWSIPVVRALFGRLGFDSTAQFDSMKTGLRLEDGVLRMVGIDVRSPILHVVGQGTIDFDGRLHHDLEIKYSLINLLGPLKVLLYWIQNSILRVAVRGTMWRPEIIFRNGIRDFFRGDPVDRPSLPLPGYSPLPPRF